MTDDRANIKVSRDFYQRHKQRCDDLGLTWEEYIEGNAPESIDSLREDMAALDERLHRVETMLEQMHGTYTVQEGEENPW